MTEMEWFASKDIQAMLNSLRGQNEQGLAVPYASGLLPSEWTPGKYMVSERKLLLFTCACCREYLDVEGSPQEDFSIAITELEKKADGLPFNSRWVHTYFHPDWDKVTLAGWAAKGIVLAPDLLREIVGNPFYPVPGDEHYNDLYLCEHCSTVIRWWPFRGESRCPECGTYHIRKYRLRDHWIRANHYRVKRLAELIYQEKRWEDMPVLGDMLEEVGCNYEALLWHLRSGPLHVRGCWALDSLLGKT